MNLRAEAIKITETTRQEEHWSDDEAEIIDLRSRKRKVFAKCKQPTIKRYAKSYGIVTSVPIKVTFPIRHPILEEVQESDDDASVKLQEDDTINTSLRQDRDSIPTNNKHDEDEFDLGDLDAVIERALSASYFKASPKNKETPAVSNSDNIQSAKNNNNIIDPPPTPQKAKHSNPINVPSSQPHLVHVGLFNKVLSFLNNDLDTLATDEDTTLDMMFLVGQAILPTAMRPISSSLQSFLSDLLEKVPMAQSAAGKKNQLLSSLTALETETKAAVATKNKLTASVAKGEARTVELSSEIDCLEKRLRDLKGKREVLEEAVCLGKSQLVKIGKKIEKQLDLRKEKESDLREADKVVERMEVAKKDLARQQQDLKQSIWAMLMLERGSRTQ